MLKKILISLLVLSLVLGSVSIVFAGGYDNFWSTPRVSLCGNITIINQKDLLIETVPYKGTVVASYSCPSSVSVSITWGQNKTKTNIDKNLSIFFAPNQDEWKINEVEYKQGKKWEKFKIFYDPSNPNQTIAYNKKHVIVFNNIEIDVISFVPETK